MLKIKNVIDYLNNIAPFVLAEEWDNPGLNVGDENSQVKGICLDLDVTESTIKCAVENRANLIITHHPLIFNPLKKINKNEYPGNIIYLLIKNDISLIAMHTNADCATGGVNSVFAETIGLMHYQPLTDYGLGAIGEISSIKLNDFVSNLRCILKDKKIKFSGSPDKIISKVALTCGAGCDKELVDLAKDKKADAYITSEIKHNYLIENYDDKLSFIDIGHYTMEYPYMEKLKKLLETNFQNLNIKITGKNPFTE